MPQATLRILLVGTLGVGLASAEPRAGPSLGQLIHKLQKGTLSQKREAAEALGALGPAAASAVPALIDALADWRTRKAATDALVRIGEPALDPLIRAARRDDTIPSFAILRRIEPRPAPFLLRMLRRPDESPLSQIAYGAFPLSGAAANAVAPALVDMLMDCRLRLQVDTNTGKVRIDNDPGHIRQFAAYALAQLGDTGARALLAAMDAKPRRPIMSANDQRDFVWHGLGQVAGSLWNEGKLPGAWLKEQAKLLQQEMADARRSTRRLAIEGLERVELKPWAAPRLIQGLRDPDIQVTLAAAGALGKITDPSDEVLSALAGAVADERYWRIESSKSTTVQYTAAQSLLALGPRGEAVLVQRGLPTLIRALSAKDDLVRWNAVRAIAEIGPPAHAAVPVLCRMLEHEGKGSEPFLTLYLSTSAAHALPAIGKPALPSIGKLLDHADPVVRGNALDALANFGRLAAPFVGKAIALLDDKEASVRRSTLQLLATIGPAAEPAVPSLLRAIRSKDEVEVRHAATCLRKLGRHEASVTALMELLPKTKSNEVYRVLEELGESGERARPARFMVKHVLKHAEGLTHLVGPATLAAIAPEEIVPLVQAGVERSRNGTGAFPWSITLSPEAAHIVLDEMARGSKDKLLVHAGCWSIAMLGDDAKKYLPALRRMLREEAHAAMAAEAAGKLWLLAAELVPDLIEVLHHPEYATRGAALDALGKIGPAHAAVVPALLRVLDFPESYDRLKAAKALAVVGPRAGSAVPRLTRLLERDDPDVKIHAAHALVRITGERSPGLDHLRRAVADQAASWHLRSTAVQALRTLGPAAEPALPELRALLRAHATMLKSEAAAALVAIGPAARSAEPELLLLLHHRDEQVRRAAAAALGELGSGRALPALAVALDVERDHDIAREMEAARSKIHGRTRYR